MRFIIIFTLIAYVSLGLENNPNCGEDYVLIAEEHDQIVPECDQFGCPEVESCDTCKEVCDNDDACAAFECNEFEGRYSCSFNGHLEHTDECGPLCQSQTVCVKNSTDIDGSHFVEPESQNRRKLWPLSSGPYTPWCNSGYKDTTNGNAYWWACGSNCAGGKYWTDYLCRCACVPDVEEGPCQATIWGDHQYNDDNEYTFSNDIKDLSRTPFGGDGVSSAYVQGSCDLVCYSSLNHYGISLVLKPGWHNMVWPARYFPDKRPFYYHDFMMWNDRFRSCKFVNNRRQLASDDEHRKI